MTPSLTYPGCLLLVQREAVSIQIRSVNRGQRWDGGSTVPDDSAVEETSQCCTKGCQYLFPFGVRRGDFSRVPNVLWLYGQRHRGFPVDVAGPQFGGRHNAYVLFLWHVSCY